MIGRSRRRPLRRFRATVTGGCRAASTDCRTLGIPAGRSARRTCPGSGSFVRLVQSCATGWLRRRESAAAFSSTRCIRRSVAAALLLKWRRGMADVRLHSGSPDVHGRTVACCEALLEACRRAPSCGAFSRTPMAHFRSPSTSVVTGSSADREYWHDGRGLRRGGGRRFVGAGQQIVRLPRHEPARSCSTRAALEYVHDVRVAFHRSRSTATLVFDGWGSGCRGTAGPRSDDDGSSERLHDRQGVRAAKSSARISCSTCAIRRGRARPIRFPPSYSST